MSEQNDTGKASLNWAKDTYTQFHEIPEKYQDYHAQGIGSLINGSVNNTNVTYNDVYVTFNGRNVKHT